MTLPVLTHPTFELEIPSTKEKVTCRPFLVKEEKILLLAQESGNPNDMIKAVKQIISNCIIEGEVNLSAAPTFDIEFIFLRLRSNSVGQTAKFSINDEDTKQEVDIEVDLNQVNVVFPEGHQPDIKLNDDVSLMMKYPTYATLEKLSLSDMNTVGTEITFDMIKSCIDKIYVGDEEVHELKDYSKKEVNDFVDSFSTDNFQDVQNFFDTMPKLEHKIEYKVGKKTKTRVLSGLADFFS